MDTIHIICFSRAEQEGRRELGLCGARAGALLIPRPDLVSVLSAVWTRKTDLLPPAAWEVWVEGASVVVWHNCLVQHIRQLNLSCSEISESGLAVFNEESTSSPHQVYWLLWCKEGQCPRDKNIVSDT